MLSETDKLAYQALGVLMALRKLGQLPDLPIIGGIVDRAQALADEREKAATE